LAALRREPGAVLPLARLLQLREGKVEPKWVECAVELATDERIGRQVVVRIPDSSLLEDDRFRGGFEDEVLRLSSITHPGLLPVLGLGEEDGHPYAILEYAPGGSLAERIGKGPQSLVEITDWLPAIADAVDTAHGLGRAHGRIGPSNVLFDREDRPLLADLGIARLLHGARARAAVGAGGPAEEEDRTGATDTAADQTGLARTVVAAAIGTLEPPAGLRLPESFPLASFTALERALSLDPGNGFAKCRDFSLAFSGVVSPDSLPRPKPAPEAEEEPEPREEPAPAPAEEPEPAEGGEWTPDRPEPGPEPAAEPEPERPLLRSRVPVALRGALWPFLGKRPLSMLGGHLLVALLVLATWVCQTLPGLGPYLRFGGLALLGAYFLSYAARVVRESAEGSEWPPEWPEPGPSREVLVDGGKGFALVLLWLAPAIVMDAATPLRLPATVLMAIAGVLLPAAFLRFALTGRLAQGEPFRALKAVAGLGTGYLLAVLPLAPVLLLRPLAGRTIWAPLAEAAACLLFVYASRALGRRAGG